MKKLYLITLLSIFFCALGVNAQNIYSDPSPLQISSEDVTIFFNAKGTDLAGLKATDEVYAHTGYNDWQNPPTWGNNSGKYLLTYVDTDLWKLYIGNISEFYGIKAGTKVTKLMFVFRDAGGNKQTRPDYSLDVYEDGLQLQVLTDTPTLLVEPYTYVKFTATTTMPADITLSVDGVEQGKVTNANTLTVEVGLEEVKDYQVKVTATAQGETVTKELTICCAEESPQVDYPGGVPQMGPVANPDGSVTFCFGAPLKDQVVIVGSWNNYQFTNDQVMAYQETDNGKYFWTTIEGLDPDEMYVYYFVVDGGKYIVGDPYARLILDPDMDGYLDNDTFSFLPPYPTDVLNGRKIPVAVYQGTMNDYNWQVDNYVVEDRSNLVIYELLFRDFTGTEGKAYGDGTVKLALEKLPYLKELGVNAVEVLPIMEFNGNLSWGYNPNFYFAVDKAYGTPNDYKEFIDACHQNGMAVILDMVFNQSDGQHPWYQMYTRAENPFYNFSFKGENGAPHAYSVLNDWNQDNPMVQQQWADVLRYWMTEYKFDGFRFDLVKGLGANMSYGSADDYDTNKYNASRVKQMRALQAVMDEVNPDAVFINENLAGAQEENEMAETGQLNWANVNEAGCQFAMGYPENCKLNRLYAPKDSRTWGSTVSYLESHDEQRMAYKQDQWAPEGIKGNVMTSMQRLGSAAAIMLMTPGSHMIWQFQEMGNAQNTKNDDNGNNTNNKIVNWSLLNEPNHRGLYYTYCRLNAVRFKNPEFFTQEAQFSIACDANSTSVWPANGFLLYSVVDGKELVTAVNPNISGSLDISYPFLNTDNDAYKVLVESYNSTSSYDAASGKITVPANCFVVIGSSDLEETGVDSIAAEDTSLRAYVGNGEIVVDYAEGGATVYALDGKVVGKVSESGRVSVPAGLYIVKTAKDSLKLLVR